MTLLICNECKSPNFSNRKNLNIIDTIIIHYTGMKNAQLALNYLCSHKSRVSSHYFINEKGKLWQLVDDDNVAWHAGVSQWLDRKNLNETSIGIELVNPGHEYGYQDFTNDQYKTLEELIKLLIDKFDIKIDRILGHSDIAPSRKLDPGEKFNWQKLAKKNLSIWPEKILNIPKNMASEKLLYNLLYNIGYDVTNHYVDSILAFKRRFTPNDISPSESDKFIKMVYSVHSEFVKIRAGY